MKITAGKKRFSFGKKKLLFIIIGAIIVVAAAIVIPILVVSANRKAYNAASDKVKQVVFNSIPTVIEDDTFTLPVTVSTDDGVVVAVSYATTASEIVITGNTAFITHSNVSLDRVIAISYSARFKKKVISGVINKTVQIQEFSDLASVLESAWEVFVKPSHLASGDIISATVNLDGDIVEIKFVEFKQNDETIGYLTLTLIEEEYYVFHIIGVPNGSYYSAWFTLEFGGQMKNFSYAFLVDFE